MKLLIAAVAVAGLAGCAAYVPYDAGYPGYPYAAPAPYAAYGAPAPYGYAYAPYGYAYAPPYPAPYYGPSLFLGATVVSGPRFHGHGSHPRFGGLQGHVGGRWGTSGGRAGGWSGRRH